jgi:tetratricopeptide (TPR) repeat protein
MSGELESILAELNRDHVASVNFSEPHKGFLCLNMIVKNESQIIERLLGSVLNIIDTYCICDTGSTDDTIEKIQTFMATAGKPGIVFSEPFRNFGYNRTVALERAAEWGTYALLLDADMKLVVSPEFNKSALVLNGYSIIQKSGNLEYFNTRIAKTGIGVRCKGPTHEYYDFPPGATGKLSTLWIEDIGDGGAKADKFERDIRLLSEGIKEEPLNERYYFYLANSYKDVGRIQEAIETYKKRVSLGGWVEEVFYACFEIGNMYARLKDMGNAIFWWLEAYNRRPCRAESLYEIVKYYRIEGKHHAAALFLNLALSIPYPKDDLLFIKSDIYNYLLDYERSILAYYTKDPINHYKYLTLLGTNYMRDNVLSNYKFYVKKIASLGTVTDFCESVEKTVGGCTDSFKSSTPCIIPWNEGYMMNVRYVNYMINGGGGYNFKHDDGKIRTLNKTVWLNRNLIIQKEHWLDAVHDETLRYQGIEDVKMFGHLDSLLCLGTCQHPVSGKIRIGFANYTLTENVLTPFVKESPFGRDCEKNWCYFHTASSDLRILYEWSPLTVLSADLQVISKKTSVPSFFRDIRGSSNGCLVGSEIWFLCHMAQYCTPRHYYHILIVLDSVTLEFKRHSILFKFHDDCIEYALGLIVESEQLLISYSRMDRTSAVLRITRDVVEKELFCQKN